MEDVAGALFTVRTEIGHPGEITEESVSRFSAVVDRLLGAHDQSLCEFAQLPLEAFPEDMKIREPIARNDWLSYRQFSLLTETEMVYYISLIPGEWMISDERASIPFEDRWTLIEEAALVGNPSNLRNRLYDLAYFVYYGSARTPFVPYLPDVIPPEDTWLRTEFIPDFEYVDIPHGRHELTRAGFRQLMLLEQELRLPLFSQYSKLELSYHRLVRKHVFQADVFTTSTEVAREEYLPLLYRIRGLFDDKTNYGSMEEVGEAQDEPGFLQNILDAIKQFGVHSATSIKNAVGTVIAKFREMVTGWLAIVGDALTRAFDWIVKRFSVVLVKMFEDTDNVFKKVPTGSTLFLYMAGSLICLSLVLDSFRLLTFKIAPAVLRHFCGSFHTGSTQSAQLASTIFNLAGTTAGIETAVKRSERLVKIAGGAGVLLTSSMGLFALFPLYLREAIMNKFGTNSMKVTYDLNRWMQKVTAVTTLAKTSRVLVSASFNKWVTDLMAKAEKLKNRIVDIKQASLFLRKYAELSQIYANLHNFNHATITRPLPYSIHLFGKPGVGKTYLSSALLGQVFSVMPNQIYAVPKSGEFWSGFNAGHIGIIMDEFLIGDSEEVKRTGLTYLDLIGTNTFYPNLADIKDPIVGIKGTPASPRVVMTMNNNAYFSVVGIPDAALNRRRNVVVEIVVPTNNPYYDHNRKVPRLDVIRRDDLVPEQMPWARFNLLPTIAGGAPTAHMDMTLQELIAVLEDNFSQFKELSDCMNRADEGETKTPDEMFDDIIRSLNGFDSEPLGVFEAFGRLGSSFFSKEEAEAQSDDVATSSSTPDPIIIDVDESDVNPDRMNTPDTTRVMNTGSNLYYHGPHPAPADVVAFWDTFGPRLPTLQVMDVKKVIKAAVATAPVSRKIRALIYKEFLAVRENYPADIPFSTRAIEYDVGMLVKTLDVVPIDWLSPAVNFIYWTCGIRLDGGTFVAQADVVATYDMRNVDPTGVCRRACIGCGKQVSQRTKKRTMYLHCGDCSDSESYFSSIGGSNEYQPQVPLKYGAHFLTPEERAEHSERWFRAVCTKFLKTRVLPVIHGFADPRMKLLEPIAEEFHDANASNDDEVRRAGTKKFYRDCNGALSKNELRPWLWAAGWMAFAFGVRYVANKLSPVPEETQDWSAPARHTTQRAVRGPKQYLRGMAQSATAHLVVSVGNSVGKGLPVAADVILTFYHILIGPDGFQADPNTSVSVTVAGVLHRYRLADCDFVSDPQDDVAFIKVPKKDIDGRTRANFSSVAKKFWTIEQAESYLGGPVCLMTDRSADLLTATVVRNECYMKSTREGGRRFELPLAIKYTAETIKGDCGAALVSNGNGIAGSIIGIHVAGGKGYGFGGSYGVSTIVTREDIESALEALTVTTMGQAQNDVLPNLDDIDTIGEGEKIHLSRRSKLSASAIVPHVPWAPAKRMPILSSSDPRSNGRDPVLSMVEDTLRTYNDTEPVVDVHGIYEEMLDYYAPLVTQTKLRHLSFDEAVRGVPGLLSSIRSSTSAGYPLCLNPGSRGKQQFIKFVDGELVCPDSFREYCMNAYEAYKSGVLADNRFVVYLKDEPISERKEREGRCRLIYCSDLVSNVVFRMVYGSLLLRFNNMFDKSPLCIGINQYSWDMEMLYQQCRGISKSFVAGDFKNFDKRVHPRFLTENFRFIMELAGDLATDEMKALFIKHQKDAPFQVLDLIITPKATHYSGCFFTTPFNCFLVEAYIRYAFKRLCGNKLFSDHIALQVMGDDHIMAVSDQASEQFNPVTIAEVLTEIGQVYTSDVKDAELTTGFKSFDQVTFLGSTPRLIDGKYCGAFLKPSLEETLLWTRNDNRSLLSEVSTAFELSSIHGREYYKWYTDCVNRALNEAGFPVADVPNWTAVSRMVANRTCYSGFDFPHAQSGDLVNINAKDVKVGGIPGSGSIAVREKALTANHQELTFGLTSNVLRTSFEWQVTDPLDSQLFTAAAPFGILALGDPDNVQNIGFDRYTFMSADVVLTFQINGNRFLAGLLAAYYMPLAQVDYPSEYANILATPHQLMEPSHNGTYELRIPYRYVRAAMNTYNRTDETLGQVFVTVLSPLKAMNNEVVSISVFSRFENCYLSVPRPPPSLVTRGFKMHPKKNVSPSHPPKGRFMGDAQGASMSTNTYNNYTNVGGSMPVTTETTNSGDLQQTISPELSIPMPLDNPPLSSGAVPMQNAFSGMSNCVGVRPTTDMQFAPSTLYRQQHHMFDDDETKIEFLLGKRCILGRFNWSTAQDDSTLLASIDLNTAFSLEEGTGIPFNVVLLNQFFFWRADIEIGIMAVKTQFHVGRIQAVMEYASPGVTAGSRTACYSDIMNFSADESHHTTLINWNAQTEFLRTYEGEGTVDPVQNYSLGNLNFYVLNRLNAPETVDPEIDCIITIRFKNPVVAEIRPYPTMMWNDYLSLTTGAGAYRIREETPFTRTGNVTINPQLFEGTLVYSATEFSLAEGTYFVWLNAIVGTIVAGGQTHAVAFSPTGDTRLVVTSTTLSFTHMVGGSNILTGWKTAQDFTFSYNPDVMGVAQSDELNGSTIEDEEVTPTITTTGHAEFVRKHPCETRLAEKFPFTISDVHEIGRRYIRMVPISNPDLDQFVLMSQVNATSESYVMHIPVQVQSALRGIYAGWTGSVKYRIFSNTSDGLSQVTINPFLNIGDKIGYSIIDPVPGSVYTTPNGIAIIGGSSIAGANPREVMYPVSSKDWGDFSVPFHTHFNFLMNSKTLNNVPVSVGTMSIEFGTIETPTQFTAFGDDLRLGIFRVPRLTRFNYNVFPPGAGGINSGRITSLNPQSAAYHGPLYTVIEDEEGVVITPLTCINEEPSDDEVLSKYSPDY